MWDTGRAVALLPRGPRAVPGSRCLRPGAGAARARVGASTSWGRFGAALMPADNVRGAGLGCSQMTVMTVRTASAARAISARVVKLARLVMVRLPLIAPAAWTAPAASRPMPQTAVRPTWVWRGGPPGGELGSQGQGRAAGPLGGRRGASEIRKARPARAGMTAPTMAAAVSPARAVAEGLLDEAGTVPKCIVVLLCGGAVRPGACQRGFPGG